MHLNDSTVHHRQVHCHLDDDDLFAILSKYVAEKSGFEIDPMKTKIQVFIRKKDTGTGFKNEAEVTLTNNIE